MGNGRQLGRSDPETLPLSPNDLARLQSMHRRQVTAPVMILDALLPNQVVTLQSSDPIFLQMLDYCTRNTQQQVVVLGENPVTGKPLSFGVLALIEPLEEAVVVNRINDRATAVTVKITALRRLQLQGQPRRTKNAPFATAACELMDAREERLSFEAQGKATKLAAKLPYMIQQWKELVVTTGGDEAALTARDCVLGGLPVAVESDDDNNDDDRKTNHWTAMAFYAAAMLNPIATFGHSDATVDIRPAMLSAQSAYERLLLAVTAIQCRMDHLSNSQR